MVLWQSWRGTRRRPPFPFQYRPQVEILKERILPSFLAAVPYPTGPYPRSVAVGDFTGTGIIDLAVANYTLSTVSVLLGNGDGSFQAKTDYTVGADPDAVAVGDFDGDGTLDLAVASVNANTVSVLLGNGNGTFQPAKHYASGLTPTALAVADLNEDGVPDLVITNNTPTATVSVLLGNGDGSFQAPVPYTIGAGAGPQAVAVGDVNDDGIPDLATANWYKNTVSVLLGNGDGSFQAPKDYAAGPSPVSMAVGDFNGDGTPDLAVTDAASNSVTVLLNAADWDGRPPAGPSKLQRPAVQRPAHSQLLMAPVADLGMASHTETAVPTSLAAADRQASPVLAVLGEAAFGSNGPFVATMTPTPLTAARQPLDAVADAWGDPVADLMAPPSPTVSRADTIIWIWRIP
jgi:hypothetical protein